MERHLYSNKTDADIQKHLSIAYKRSLSAKGLEKLHKIKHLQHLEQRTEIKGKLSDPRTKALKGSLGPLNEVTIVISQTN